MPDKLRNEGYSDNFRKLIKKEQAVANHLIRDMNTAVIKDNLWKGRFFIRQINRNTGIYDDGSGVYINYHLRVFDKKTKKYFDYYGDFHKSTCYWQISMEIMNDAIVERFDVWRKEDRHEIYNSKVDYSKVDYPLEEYTPLYSDEWANSRSF